MNRIYPARIWDKYRLSHLFDQLLGVLETSPLQVRIRALSYDTQIPECVFRRLRKLHLTPDDALNITAEDYHIIFANILFRYPTVQIYEMPDQTVFFKM